jgi:hypothetical protein
VPSLLLTAGELDLLDGIAKALTTDANEVTVDIVDGVLRFNPLRIRASRRGSS